MTQEMDNGSEGNGNNRPPEVYKVLGGPGSGKTTRVVGNPELDIKGLFLENADEYPLEEQMLVTYTNAGVDEAADRLYRMTDAPKYKINERVTTIHSRCFQTLGIKRDDVPDHWDKKKFCDVHDLPFGWDDDSDDIMGADQQQGNLLFRIYDWLQNNRKNHSEWRDCPADWGFKEDPEQLMDEWDGWKEDNGWVDFGDMIEDVIELGYTQLKNLGWGVLFPDEDTTTWEMFEEALEDPQRDPDIIRGKGAFVDTKVLYVDEFQDLTRLQYEWYMLQRLACEKVYVGGDDDQCLPPNAPVEVKNDPLFNPEDGDKEYQKPIKDVKVGDFVRTMESNGQYTYRRVSDVTKKRVNDKRFKLFQTESGRRTAVTYNHKMFVRAPTQGYESVEERNYVYLMRGKRDRWRVGVASDLRQRISTEEGSSALIPLSCHDTREEALVEEEIISLKYNIPKILITSKNDGEILSKKVNRDKVYDSVDVKIDGLERDTGVDTSRPSCFRKGGSTSEDHLLINIKMCSDVRGSEPLHTLRIITKDDNLLKKLSQFRELKFYERSDGRTKVLFQSKRIRDVGKIALSIQSNVGGDIRTYMVPTETGENAVVTPAGNVTEGMLFPVARDDEVVWEEVTQAKDVFKSTDVYDLTVDGTHNFTTSGIGVHNTIYEWSGASSDFLLDEEGDFEVLETTYRIPKEIWDVCDGMIKQVDHRQEKEMEPAGDGGEFITYRSPSARQLMEHLREDECMALFRARYQVDEFREHLHSYGVPYRNMSTYDIWDKDLTNIKNALGVLCSGKGKINGDWIDSMIECADPGMVSLKNGMTESEKVMSHFSGVTNEELNELFPFMEKYSNGNVKAEAYVNKSDDLNYYQKQALKGVINNKTWDLDPDRLRIGTIHSSKGKEAETVLLATDTTNTIAENMMEELREQGDMDVSTNAITDGERRVYYVGMTRASKKLVLAQGVIDPSMSIDINTLLDGDHVPDEWESGQPTLNDSW